MPTAKTSLPPVQGQITILGAVIYPSLCCKDLNDTMGPEGTVPSQMVFRTFPTFPSGASNYIWSRQEDGRDCYCESRNGAHQERFLYKNGSESESSTSDAIQVQGWTEESRLSGQNPPLGTPFFHYLHLGQTNMDNYWR